MGTTMMLIFVVAFVAAMGVSISLAVKVHRYRNLIDRWQRGKRIVGGLETEAHRGSRW